MKILRRVSSRCSFAAFLVLAISPAANVTAAVKNWVAAGSGQWNVPGNWSGGSVPAGGDQVNIAFADGFARTVTLNSNAPPLGLSLGLVSIDLTGGITSSSTLSIPNNNNLTAAALAVGGYNGSFTTSGRGAVNHYAGTTYIDPGGDLILGWGAGSTGTYTLDGGTLVANQAEWVGYNGTGTFHHSAGTNTINASGLGWLDVGANAGASGTYNLSYSGQLISNMSEYIGDFGTGNFNQTGGTNSINGANHSLYLGYAAGGFGTYTLSSGGFAVNNGDEYIGYAATGNIVQKGGTFNHSGGENTVSASRTLYIGYLSGSTGIYTISNYGKLTTGNLVVGPFGTGIMTIQDQASVYINNNLSINGSGTPLNMLGGTLRFNTVNDPNRIDFDSGTIQLAGNRFLATDLTIGNLFSGADIPAGKGLTVEGFTVLRTTSLVDGTLISLGDLNVGDSQGHGTLTIRDQALVSVGGIFNMGDGADNGPDVAVLNLMGGTLRINSYQVFGGTINFTSGTLQLTGSFGGTVSDGHFIGLFFGASPTIPTGKGLTIDGNATLMSATTLDGGTLTAGQLTNAYNLRLLRGTLNIKNQAVTIGASGILGDTLDLNDDMTVNITLGITNQGLVTGDGQIGGPFANAAAGELRGEPGKSLKLTGANNTNVGRINLLGGQVEFTQNLTNNVGGLISGNGSILTGGLTNQGTMNFAGTANVLGDVTNSVGGKIISGGGGATIFYDDVINNSEIRTSTNGFTVFFGSVSGSGWFNGTGTVNFEGDLSPGSSPAAVSFAGDVVLGPDATLVIELGGTTPGSQYDQINVAGELTLDGTLEISLINGFTPTAGQTFDFLNWGSLAGAFSSIELPTLPGLAWNTAQLASGMLSVAIPGDFNLDGTVDAADYVVWRKNPGGIYTQNDFHTWRANFGQTAGFGSGATGSASANPTVPEPTTFVMLIVAATAVSTRRRWRAWPVSKLNDV